KEDPSEMNNLYGKPGTEKITNRLKEELKKLQKQYDDPIESKLAEYTGTVPINTINPFPPSGVDGFFYFVCRRRCFHRWGHLQHKKDGMPIY
ncbi:MAG: hypothetical protein ACMV17_06795, partial [Macellibacteroides fermentans]|uniref:hypothetical protein n=1 Tax=Macellibacteroides fermentans TaxID=879969 RepID=UPI003B6AD993